MNDFVAWQIHLWKPESAKSSPVNWLLFLKCPSVQVRKQLSTSSTQNLKCLMCPSVQVPQVPKYPLLKRSRFLSVLGALSALVRLSNLQVPKCLKYLSVYCVKCPNALVAWRSRAQVPQWTKCLNAQVLKCLKCLKYHKNPQSSQIARCPNASSAFQIGKL